MLGYLSLDITCSLKLTVFLTYALRKLFASRNRMFAVKYPSQFLRHMEAIIFLEDMFMNTLVNTTEADKGQSQNIYEIRKNVFKIRKSISNRNVFWKSS